MYDPYFYSNIMLITFWQTYHTWFTLYFNLFKLTSFCILPLHTYSKSLAIPLIIPGFSPKGSRFPREYDVMKSLYGAPLAACAAIQASPR